MAPIGPGFTVGAIFAFENNTPVRGCDGWPWRGWRQHSMRPAQSRRAHVKRRRAQLLNASKSRRRRSCSHPSAARPSTAGWRKTVARLGLLPGGDGRSGSMLSFATETQRNWICASMEKFNPVSCRTSYSVPAGASADVAELEVQ
jgi:hypothetical protein